MKKIYIKEIRPNQDFERNFKKRKGITNISATGRITNNNLIDLQIGHLRGNLFIERKYRINIDLYYVQVQVPKSASQELLNQLHQMGLNIDYSVTMPQSKEFEPRLLYEYWDTYLSCYYCHSIFNHSYLASSEFNFYCPVCGAKLDVVYETIEEAFERFHYEKK